MDYSAWRVRKDLKDQRGIKDHQVLMDQWDKRATVASQDSRGFQESTPCREFQEKPDPVESLALTDAMEQRVSLEFRPHLENQEDQAPRAIGGLGDQRVNRLGGVQDLRVKGEILAQMDMMARLASRELMELLD
jgi:hypothetical protein